MPQSEEEILTAKEETESPESEEPLKQATPITPTHIPLSITRQTRKNVIKLS